MNGDHYIIFCLLPRHNPGERLDLTLAGVFPRHARTAWKTLINSGGALINGKCCRRPAHKVAGGSEIAVDFSALPALRNETCAAENLPLHIVYEDDDIIVLNKAAGMVVHPGHGNRNGTLQAALLFHHPPSATLPRAGIVHRLDKDTTGLLVAAKTEAARQSLIAQFKERSVRREYLAIVHGTPAATGLVNRPLGPARNIPGHMTVRTDGREAITRYAVINRWPGFSLLRCWLETGRTHQIRVHLEYAGYPVAGDLTYHRRARNLPFVMCRQALHAETLRLLHPASGGIQEWHAAPPADMQNALQQLKQLSSAAESPC